MAPKLELSSTFGPLAPGDEVEANANEWNIEVVEGGSIHCHQMTGFDGTYGVAETNNEKIDKLKVNRTLNNFFLTSGCENKINTGPVEVAVFNLNNNTNEIQGNFNLHSNLKAEYVSASSLDTVVAFGAPEIGNCYYEVKKLKGTEFSFPGPLIVAFTKQKVKMLKAFSSITCPKKVTFSVLVFDWWAHSGAAEAPIEGVFH